MTIYRIGFWLVPFMILITASSAALALSDTGEACFADDGQDRAMCVALIGAMRGSAAHSKKVDPTCPVSDPHDMKVSYGVIDWIRSHPERKGENLGKLIREGLMEVDPCTRGALTSD